jgi:hypothetical protein
MTWWLLLYSFSILARYEPRRWMKLLDLGTQQWRYFSSTRWRRLSPWCRNLYSRLSTATHLAAEATDVIANPPVAHC